MKRNIKVYVRGNKLYWDPNVSNILVRNWLVPNKFSANERKIVRCLKQCGVIESAEIVH